MSNNSWNAVPFNARGKVSDHNSKFSGMEYVLLLPKGTLEPDLSEESGNFIVNFDGFKDVKLSAIVKLKGDSQEFLSSLNSALDLMLKYVTEANHKSLKSFYIKYQEAKSDILKMKPIQLDILRTFLLDRQNLKDAIKASLLV